MAAGAVGNIARLFGMSRPPILQDITPYKPVYAGNLANSNMPDSVSKLTFDAKQELTIDPGVLGIGGEDEMSIASIAQRESYFTQFTWSSTNGIGNRLFTCYVNPSLAGNSWPEMHFTPMCYAAYPFRYWRGTIRYRFQIAASNFHKGRLKIVYDPYLDGVQDELVQYTHVLDLANDRDFVMDVKWGQRQSYLERMDPFTTTLVLTDGTGHPGPEDGKANGVLSVFVMNELTTPAADIPPVSILVSVSAGPDFEVASPDPRYFNRISLFPQLTGARDAGLVPQMGVQADEDLTTDETIPIADSPSDTMAAPLRAADHTQHIYFGDPVTSLRQIFKRYMLNNVYSTTIPDAYTTVKFVLPDFPEYYGYVPYPTFTATTTPVNPTPFEFARVTHLTYYTPAFLGRRGGIRFKYLFAPDNPVGIGNGYMTVSRRNNRDIPISITTLPTSQGTQSALTAERFKTLSTHTWAGAQTTPIDKNPVLEVEIPFYTYYRFSPARKLSVTDDDSLAPKHEVYVDSAPGQNPAIVRYVSTGEDFGLYFFQAAPSFYLFAVDPPGSTLA
jgi:hypothetical protein